MAVGECFPKDVTFYEAHRLNGSQTAKLQVNPSGRDRNWCKDLQQQAGGEALKQRK